MSFSMGYHDDIDSIIKQVVTTNELFWVMEHDDAQSEIVMTINIGTLFRNIIRTPTFYALIFGRGDTTTKG